MSHAVRLFDPESTAPLKVSDVVLARLEHLAGRASRGDFAPENLLTHRHYLTQFSRAFDIAVSDCRQQDLESWINKNDQWKSGHTRKGVIAIILACFQWAADPEQGNLIEHCPFRRIKAVTEIPYEPRRAALPSEYLAIMREASIELKQGLFFIYRTGCRPCEMREMLWPWVLLDHATPHISLAKHKTIRKTGRHRLIGLDSTLIAFLKGLKAKRKTRVSEPCDCDVAHFGILHLPTDHVFLNCEHNYWKRRSFAQNVRRCAVRAGLDEGVEKKVSAGCLRTMYACDLLEANFSNRKVADVLGHESTWMVDQIYGAETRRRVSNLDDIAKQAAELRKKPEGGQ